LSAQVPEHINDKYFARVKAEAKAKKEGDIFEAKKEEYKPSEERKKDQVEVDKQVFVVTGHFVPYLSFYCSCRFWRLSFSFTLSVRTNQFCGSDVFIPDPG
jgi:hypothetical protein